MPDLRKFDTATQMAKGATMTIRDPYDASPIKEEDGKEWFMELMGVDAPEYRANQRRALDERMEMMRSQGRNLTAAESEDEELHLVARSIKKWFLVLDGETPELSVANAKKVLRDFPWLYEQAATFQKKRANYRQD